MQQNADKTFQKRIISVSTHILLLHMFFFFYARTLHVHVSMYVCIQPPHLAHEWNNKKKK